MISDGWHRFPTVKIGAGWLASAEYFKDGRPVPEGDRVGTIRTAKHKDITKAEAMLGDDLDR